MKRPEEANPKKRGAAKRLPFPDPTWEERFPQVCEFMTTDVYEDGSVRERSGLTVKVQDGKILVMLNDPTVRRSLYRVGLTIDEAVDALETALSGANCDWRIWKEDYGSKRKGK